jgi:hypothetical protein
MCISCERYDEFITEAHLNFVQYSYATTAWLSWWASPMSPSHERADINHHPLQNGLHVARRLDNRDGRALVALRRRQVRP